MSSKEKSLRPKLRKLNLIKLQKNLRDYIQKDMNCIYSGKIQLKTVVKEMN